MKLSRRALLAAAAPAPLPPPDRIVVALPGREIVRAEWDGSIDSSARPGSLWKPFLALNHPGNPRLHCDGRRCWLGRRHGWLDLPAALAQSCNQYFHQLYPSLPQPLNLLGLPQPAGDDWPNWPATPRQLALAYAELLARRAHHPLVLAGLRQAAGQGTARPLGDGWLAKTGTGPSARHAGDGWVVAARPADTPTELILFRQRGVTGAQTAARLARESR